MEHAGARAVAELATGLHIVGVVADGFTGITRDGREIRIERVAGVATEWIVLRSPICAAHEMDPQLVLERNARLAFATIVLACGVYWLRVALPADSAELADAKRAVALVIEGASALAPRAAHELPGDAFAHFAT